MPQKIYIASDHAGINLKKILIGFLDNKKYIIEDLGPNKPESVDYPDFAKKLVDKVKKDTSHKGILICGTGIGMCIVANKTSGIRAALCSDKYSAKMSIEHNNANVLCLGARVINETLSRIIVSEWLESRFSNVIKHQKRVNKIE